MRRSTVLSLQLVFPGPCNLGFWLDDCDQNCFSIFSKAKTNLKSIMGQCCKTFFLTNLRVGQIGWNACPWQAFPAQPNVRKSVRPKWKVLHFSLGPWSYPRVLYQPGKSCKGQTLWLIWRVRCRLTNVMLADTVFRPPRILTDRYIIIYIGTC